MKPLDSVPRTRSKSLSFTRSMRPSIAMRKPSLSLRMVVMSLKRIPFLGKLGISVT